MPRHLADYRRKRDFTQTQEPAGARHKADERSADGALHFVIQKHDATRLHYDFRLELDGTLKSWAIPKGPSLDPADKRLAVHVEDHPLDYADFEGHIPEGQYGGGDVIVWDRGTWHPHGDPRKAYRDGKLKFDLNGEKLHGAWALVRTHLPGSGRRPKEQWLLIKERDDQVRASGDYDVTQALPASVISGENVGVQATENRKTDRTERAPVQPPDGAEPSPLPKTLEPQLATLVDAPPVHGEWDYEVKFDGYRILARLDGDAPRLFSRNGRDWTAKLPRQARTLHALGLREAWLDGEVVVMGEHGAPDFQALQNAFETAHAERIVYFLFDLPFCNGMDLRGVPLRERRALLQRILDAAPGDLDRDAVQFSATFNAAPEDLLASACHMSLEGVIGKRADAPYRAGRSPAWIKLKCGQRQEFVIGGYSAPKGSRSNFGALLLGVYDDAGALPGEQKLRYAGRVGTGFNETSLRALHHELSGLTVDAPPFSNPPMGADARDVQWVKPERVAEIAFAEWTREGIVRQAVFQGLRDDKPARSIVRETAKPPNATKRKEHRVVNAAERKVRPGAERIAGVDVTHPDRVIEKASGTTKADLARYYAHVADWMLPHLYNRPVALVRAPDGIDGEHFFQKHAAALKLPDITQLNPALDPGHASLLAIGSAQALVGAVQMGTVEFHTWNALADRIEQPDRVVFDIDPDPALPFARVIEATQLTLALLDELGLKAFLKTSGGRGMHVVVPLTRREAAGWGALKDFAQAVVQHMAATFPDRFVAKMGPQNRVGKIFIDYLRNNRGASTVAAYSVRARTGLPVSVPIRHDELTGLLSSAQWTLRTLPDRLAKLDGDPWGDYAGTRQSVTSDMRKRIGADD
ncbi:DNA ligase D [Ralstonia insidiosa]|jgi:bifunctional non-homologous end joining protein LigD|uniref:DNA ligase D n=1 Tax=Ralstonia TaxID=48736 RepID=UPI000664B4C0|nr:DNA ligase D [Ralstonia insidiosa]KMW46574.1 ATP-dependent DNA ligase [Ralstonia sp. MD27]MBX3771711.1 DNA ligase D [Ralstonia pickettii]NPA02503.1 DNA ligase D [Betaproteobacteria bacterium]MBA9855810.1 DNA ligase D [Ralstonia insidiosa]MBA9868753.1 DNA ligase D [Ralstonia insidiosa]